MPQSSASPVFPAERHADLRAELDYPLKEKSEVREPADTDWFDWISDFEFDPGAGSFRILLVLLIVVLGLLIFRALGDVSLRRRLRGEAGEADRIEIGALEEERMVAEGVEESLLERAEKTRQFDVAVRLLYIQLLKELQDGGLIEYRRDYSNRDYQNQLGASRFLNDFREVTADYERYWYGKYALEQLSYRLVKKKFTALSAAVRRATAPKEDDYV